MTRYLLPREGNFYRANLHSHSTDSDGHFTPAELVEGYRAQGYSILAISDHNTFIDRAPLCRDDFLVLNSYEFNHALTKQLEEWDGTVLESAFSRNQEDGTTDYDLTVRRRKEISYAEMKEFIAKHEEIISATNSSAKK